MAKKEKKIVKKVDVNPDPSPARMYEVRGNHRVPVGRDCLDVQPRPACTMGRKLHNAMVDGVRLGASSLLAGQFDDRFGEIDPASDIHTDKHLLADALMRRDAKASKVQAVGDGAAAEIAPSKDSDGEK